MRPIEGVVVAVLDQAVTIRMENGMEGNVINYNKLKFGDLVYVLYDFTTGEIRKLFLKGTFLVDDVPLPDKEEPLESGEIVDDGRDAMFAALSLSPQWGDE
jgi:hypothetical protein